MLRPRGGFSDENVVEKAKIRNLGIVRRKLEYCQNQKSGKEIVNEKSRCYNLYQYMIQNLKKKRGKT